MEEGEAEEVGFGAAAWFKEDAMVDFPTFQRIVEGSEAGKKLQDLDLFDPRIPRGDGTDSNV